jgi:hypothetical protein
LTAHWRKANNRFSASFTAPDAPTGHYQPFT